jgi:hypothetical protein
LSSLVVSDFSRPTEINLLLNFKTSFIKSLVALTISSSPVISVSFIFSNSALNFSNLSINSCLVPMPKSALSGSVLIKSIQPDIRPFSPFPCLKEI